MNTGTASYEATYTVADIKRVLDRFAADYAMIAQATGLRSREAVARHVGEIRIYAEAEYLQEIDVTLFNKDGKEIQAVQYRVSDSASGWTNQQPGNNLWPYTADGRLRITLTMNKEWFALDKAKRDDFDRRNGLNWPEGDRDLSHQSLAKQFDRRFASNGYGLEKHIYKAI